MEIVVIPHHRVNVATAMMWYKVGAVDEQKNKTGLAHFLEHLMFKGTENMPDFTQTIADHGGESNAFTTQDYTAYHQNILSDKLPMVLQMEADRMQHLKLTDVVVNTERNVVLEENSVRVESNPQAVLGQKMDQALFKGLPYEVPTIGWRGDIEKLSRGDAVAFYEQYYTPNNVILVVGGDVDPYEVRNQARQYFGDIPRRSIPDRIKTPDFPPASTARVTHHDPRVSQKVWVRKYLSPSYQAGNPDHVYGLQVLAQIWGGNTTSRLYQSLVVEQKLAVEVGVQYSPQARYFTDFMIYAIPADGVDMDVMERAIENQLQKFLQDGVTQEDFERAKNNLAAQVIYAKDDFQTGARLVGMALASGQSLADFEQWPQKISAATPDQVITAAKFIMNDTRHVTGLLLGHKK